MKPDMVEVEQIVACLRGGGVVLIPTDTVYGLAVLPTSSQAVERVYALKRRPKNVNLPIMVASEGALGALGLEVNEAVSRLLRSSLVPGALTLAMGFRPTSPRPRWLEDREEVAIRIPNDKRLLLVLAQTGPVLVTSANAHGSTTPESLADALAQLDGEPDLAIDGGALHSVPSTLVNCRCTPPVVEREGAIPAERILEILR